MIFDAAVFDPAVFDAASSEAAIASRFAPLRRPEPPIYIPPEEWLLFFADEVTA